MGRQRRYAKYDNLGTPKGLPARQAIANGPPPRRPQRRHRRQSGRSSGVEHNLAKVGVEGSNPFARSSGSEHAEMLGKPSLRRSDASVSYDGGLRNVAPKVRPKHWGGSGKCLPRSYRNVLRKRPSGLTWHKGVFYYRRHVPEAVRLILGKREVWRSLDTDSVSVARRRMSRIAAEVEAEFEKARLTSNLTVDLALIRPFRNGGEQAYTLDQLVEKLAEKLSLRSDAHPPLAVEKTLAEVFALYFSDPRRSWCKRTEGSYATTRKWVLDIFGTNIPITAITREQCREFVKLLVRMPVHAHQLYPGKSIRDAVKASEGKKVRVITAANVNAHVTRFCATMNWALEEGYLERNPARRLRIPDPVPKAEKRLPFSSHQLQAIFNAPLYTGCEDDEQGYARRGGVFPKRARFWVPLIALFSGMRLNEICQLDSADIVSADGVLCFRVCARSPSSSGKRVKTASSERLVPVHPILHLIGLPAYHSQRRQARDLKLFPELSVSPLGYHSVSFSRWFTRFAEHAGASAEKTCFHSFRHNFRDALRVARVPRELALLLGGWSSGGEIADFYGSGFGPTQLGEEISKVAYPKLDLSHLLKRSDS